MATRAFGPSSSFTTRTYNEGNTSPGLGSNTIAATPKQPGLRLLAFDDGGARGLTMLLLLRHILREVDHVSQQPGLPCEYFDLIAGSGTGGLIALLLGRLRLSMDDAIECYTRVVERVFLRTKAAKFRDAPFEEVLKEICNRFGNGSDTQMLAERGPRCNTFVCVQKQDTSGLLHPQRLRTYAHPAEPSFRCTFVEAVRATMGNPIFFDPPTLSDINGTPSTYLNAGDARCNPSFDLLDEARSLFPSRQVTYFVSLGAGRANTIDPSPPRGIMHQPRLPSTCMTAMLELAVRCDAISEAFIQENSVLASAYYRFTHDQGCVDGKMAQWEQVAVLKEFLKPYSLAVDKRALELETKIISARKAELSARRRAW
uniref:PNPLA domain-containing protein n=1 Tax=Schizophyllum commune (strain H4-8 / FGSC 9210) TaxID=578458 RepID=D8QBE3_SCHCM